MRKFYPQIATLILALVCLQANAKTTEDSCHADFERVSSTTINLLTAGFRALPWINSDKKPEQICWSFGDNRDTCINYDPALTNNYYVAHTYANAGTYSVCVKILYQGGCLAYNCKPVQISIADSCRANFETVSSTSNALGKYFVAQPWHNLNKKPVLVCWNFGDNHDTCIQYSTGYTGSYAVFHLYSHTDNYNVCVKILYDGGCESHYCKVVQAGATDSCHADFERVSSTTINLLTAGFRALPWINSDKKPEQICWSFGDNRDTCINYDPALTNDYYVAHTYANAGTYNVCVKILYQGGCLAYNCKPAQIAIADSCRANFETVSSTSNALGKYFVAQPWHNHNKKPVLVCWNFGDNHDTCIQYSTAYTGSYAVFHLYSHTDNYNVCVKILYDGGCESHYCKFVQAGATDSCHADFERVSTNTDNLLAGGFRALPWISSDKKPEQICWTFGDNHDTCIKYDPALSSNYFVAHTYANAGTYNVCVKILYQGGCIAYNCKSVKIGSPDSCRVSFETVATTVGSLGKYFVAQPWHNHNKKPVQVCWNFGDNHDTCIQYSTSYTGAYAVFHSYSHAGSYNVCVKIRYDGGCESYYCKALQVGEPDSCRADFERIPVSAANDAFRVYYRALPWNNHDKKPARICWSFGDGRDTCISYPENYTGGYAVGHNYERSGMYEVCVRIIYFGGCEAKKCRIVNVFLYNTDTCRVHLFEITSSVTSLARGFYFTSINDTRPSRICWNFGDGTDTCIIVEPNATEVPHGIRHTYPAPGVYRACVKVLFINGCSASDCEEVAIRTFTDLCGGYYTDSLVNAHTYSFKGFSIHKPADAVLSYRWTFGDGSSGDGQEVAHTYNAAGVYRVCLLIKTEKGCETRICNDVRIAGTTQPTLQLSPNPVVNVLHALFYSTLNETVTIKILNSNGVVIRSFTRTALAGPNTWDFDTGGLLPGVYLFVVQSPNQFASGIFFKL